MLRIARPQKPRHRENTIALINIVFLMLIFFLVAGTLTKPLDPNVSLITTSTAERSAPPDALFVTADGTTRSHGAEIDPAAFLAARRIETGVTDLAVLEIKVAADRDLPATRLVDIVGQLREAGAQRISIVTERGAP